MISSNIAEVDSVAEVISSVAVVFMDSFVAMQFSRNEITSCRLCNAESNQHHNYLSKIGVKERQQDCGISQLRVEFFLYMSLTTTESTAVNKVPCGENIWNRNFLESRRCSRLQLCIHCQSAFIESHQEIVTRWEFEDLQRSRVYLPATQSARDWNFLLRSIISQVGRENSGGESD
jgi:hypothetical protein